MKNFLIALGFMLSLCLGLIVFSEKKHIIYIYEDEGVSTESLKQTLAAFGSLAQKYTVKTIDAQQIKKGVWAQDAVLLVMPGGADLPYVKNLNGLGNAIIKQYVIDGGAFLGICAGAYYATSYVAFDQHGPLEVVGDRELAFFKGNSIGPVLAPYDYQSNSGSRAATIHVDLPDLSEAIVFYNGGCFFEAADRYAHTQIIGTYENGLPAIILIPYGQGKVLLSGVHFEYNSDLLDDQDPYIQNIIELLHQGNDSRQRLFQELMQLIGITP